jgi:hypothetical protein
MTPEEQIQHERLIAQVLRIRNPSDERSTLYTWLNSNLAIALIGVIGTGVVGTILSGMIQDRSKNNELSRMAQESRLESQNAAVGKVLERVGAFLSATDDLLTTVNNANTERGRLPNEVKQLQKWKADVRQRRDTADVEWRRDKGGLGFTLNYVFDGNRSVSDGWRQLLRAEDQFETCTRNWYIANAEKGSDEAADVICTSERSAFEQSVEAFTTSAVAARLKPE